MTSKSTWMCARATPPGGMVATFIDSFLAPTFFADMPFLYWMPFHCRQLPLPRMTKMPSPPSMAGFRLSCESAMNEFLRAPPLLASLCDEGRGTQQKVGWRFLDTFKLGDWGALLFSRSHLRARTSAPCV